MIIEDSFVLTNNVPNFTSGGLFVGSADHTAYKCLVPLKTMPFFESDDLPLNSTEVAG